LGTTRFTTTAFTRCSGIASVDVDAYGARISSSAACSSVCPTISRDGVSARIVMCRRTSSRSNVGLVLQDERADRFARDRHRERVRHDIG
jgi:hypothetical protein